MDPILASVGRSPEPGQHTSNPGQFPTRSTIPGPWACARAGSPQSGPPPQHGSLRVPEATPVPTPRSRPAMCSCGFFSHKQKPPQPCPQLPKPGPVPPLLQGCPPTPAATRETLLLLSKGRQTRQSPASLKHIKIDTERCPSAGTAGERLPITKAHSFMCQVNHLCLPRVHRTDGVRTFSEHSRSPLGLRT